MTTIITLRSREVRRVAAINAAARHEEARQTRLDQLLEQKSIRLG
jgi:hypothetical protein